MSTFMTFDTKDLLGTSGDTKNYFKWENILLTIGRKDLVLKIGLYKDLDVQNKRHNTR